MNQKKKSDEIVQLPNLNHHLNIAWFLTEGMNVWGSAVSHRGKPGLEFSKLPKEEKKKKKHDLYRDSNKKKAALFSLLSILGAIRQWFLEISKDVQDILKRNSGIICLHRC